MIARTPHLDDVLDALAQIAANAAADGDGDRANALADAAFYLSGVEAERKAGLQAPCEWAVLAGEECPRILEREEDGHPFNYNAGPMSGSVVIVDGQLMVVLCDEHLAAYRGAD